MRAGFKIRSTLRRFTLLFLLIAFSAFAHPNPQEAQSAASLPEPEFANAPPANSPVVYVSDFDLDVLNVRASRGAPPRTSPPTSAGKSSSSPSIAPKAASSASPSRSSSADASSDPQPEETPADRAHALVTAMSENLVRALNQAGYHAYRFPDGTQSPKSGLRIRGVFAESDEKNRARRLLVGGEPVSPNILVFVGVNNLSQPEQPLYELANPPINDSRHGPVITVTSYAPAVRFELSRDPTEDEFKKIATQIAADLTALLNTNPLLSTQ